MTLMAIAALCAAAAAGGKSAPAGVDCTVINREYQAAVARVAPMLSAPESRDALARVSYAEAGNQGDTGLAGVLYTILNRLIDGGWGASVSAVLNAPGQFEPAMRAGGWQHLAARSAVERAHVDTILNLALAGRLPDPTNGARFFQNPRIVANRVAAGDVAASLVNFGGQKPIAVIKDHAFYDGAAVPPAATRASALFVPVQSASAGSVARTSAEASQPRSLFVPLSR